jgi:hypothetical protein
MGGEISAGKQHFGLSNLPFLFPRDRSEKQGGNTFGETRFVFGFLIRVFDEFLAILHL